MKCPHCNNELREGLVFCPSCGKRIEAKTGNRKSASSKQTGEGGRSWGIFIAIIIFAAVALGGYEGWVWYYTGKMRIEGEHAYRRDNYKTCIKSLRYVVGKKPKTSQRERTMLAECYIGAGEPRTAVEQMEDAVSWAKKDPVVNAAFARTLYMAEKYNKAVKQSKTTLALQPANQQALQYLGMSQLKLGDYKIAEKSLEKALSGAQAEDAIEVNNSLGLARFNLEDPKGAIDAYEASLSLYANQLQVLIDLAILYQNQKDFAKCYSCARRAAEIAKQSGNKKSRKKANEIAKLCGAVVQVSGIKDCVLKRRGIDRGYISTFSDFKLYIDELNAEPQDYLGKPADTLIALSDTIKTLKEQYMKLSCPNDVESYFQISKATFIAQLTSLEQAISALKEYVETKDKSDLERFEMMQPALDRTNDEISNIWRNEEEKFGVKAMFNTEPPKPQEDTQPQ